AQLGVGVLVGADLLDGVESVGDHGVFNVVRGDRDGFQQHGRNRVARLIGDLGERVLLASLVLLAGGGGDCHGGGHFSLRADGLVDRHVLVAGDDPLDAGEFGVLAGDGRHLVHACGFEGSDDAGGHAVVGAVDTADVVGADRGDGL